jgi:FAD synthase
MLQMTSTHYTNDRRGREALIQQIGYGYTVKTVIVDRGHRNGPEVHKISSTGIVTIYNQRTMKMVTRLIARPGQITRYYEQSEKIPANLLKIAREHQQQRYNER